MSKITKELYFAVRYGEKVNFATEVTGNHVMLYILHTLHMSTFLFNINKVVIISKNINTGGIEVMALRITHVTNASGEQILNLNFVNEN